MRNAQELNLNGDASGDLAGATVDINNHFNISAQAVVTGTSTGTLKMQVSNDMVKPVVNWSDLPSATVSIAGAGSYLIPKQDISYRWFQLVYTHTNAAAGTINAIIKTNGY